MRVYLEAGDVISALGMGLEEHLAALESMSGGIRECTDKRLSPTPFPVAMLPWTELREAFALGFPEAGIQLESGPTPFEQVASLAASRCLEGSPVKAGDPGLFMILSTTKGNVDLLENKDSSGDSGADLRLGLAHTASRIGHLLGLVQPPLVLSNACISGVAALLMAQRFIRAGKARHVLVLGADILSRFVVSGFQSFLSLSSAPCRPYDAERDGLSLGEAAAAVLVSSEYGDMEILSGAVSNDANHISGPSRTGEGLYRAVSRCLRGQQAPGLISAHGTATPYNDEMEAMAMDRAGLRQVPLNSLKGYLGHTLGAAGVVESLLNLEAMRRALWIPTLGLKEQGVSKPLHLSRTPEDLKAGTLLKVASGFGGSNAALLIRKRP